MKTKLIAMCMYLSLIGNLARDAKAEELPFMHMTTEGTIPLPSGSVQNIMQDRSGFIWLAFFTTGISRFDGHSMEHYSILDGLLDATVRELVEDQEGYLWVGTESGLVVSTKPLDAYAPTERIRFTSKVGDNVLAQKRTKIGCVAVGLDGWVWQGTGGEGLYLYRLKDGKLETKSISTDILGSGKDIAVTSMTVRKDGTIWVALKEGLFLLFDRNGKQSILDPQQYGAERKITRSMTEGPSGSFWIGYVDGSVSRFDPTKNVVFEDLASPLKERAISIVESSTGELWVASLGNGLARFSINSDSKPDHFHPKDGLLSDTFWRIMEDRDGTLWFGQNGGLSKLMPDYRAVGRYTKMTLKDASVFASLPPYRLDKKNIPRASAPVYCQKNGFLNKFSPLWLGTGCGLVAICNGKVTEVIKMKDGLYSDSVYALETDPQGRLWIGTSQGLNFLTFDEQSTLPEHTSKFKRIRLFGKPAIIGSLPTGSVSIYTIISRQIPESKRGSKLVDSLWITGTASLWALVQGKWYIFKQSAGIPGSATTGLEFDSYGRLWVGTTDRGLLNSIKPMSRAILNHLASAPTEEETVSLSALMSQAIGEISAEVFISALNKDKGIPSNSITTIRRKGDLILVGTPAGVVVVNTKQKRIVKIHNLENGLGGNIITGIAQSPTTGRFWISQNHGLAELNNDITGTLRIISKADGLTDNEAWAYGTVTAGSNGAIHLGTPKGLSIVRPWLMTRKTTPPTLRLSRIRKSRDAAGHFEIAFDFTGLDYGNPENIFYKWRLVGYNDVWSTPSHEARLRYTNLPPGTYAFELMGFNQAGVWTTQPLRYKFEVK